MSNHALIIGYGASGKAATALLQKQGLNVYVYDDRVLEGSCNQIKIKEFQNLHFQVAILSPGIHPRHAACLEAARLKIPILGEAEFALRSLPQRKIAITGTNGKTTVTYLCEHVLKYAGYNALACGNVSKDKALSQIALDCPLDAILCVELSSFQLDTLTSPVFEAGIILNITPDHLDRYDDMQSYAQSKFRLQKLCHKFYVFRNVLEQFSLLSIASDITIDISKNESFLGIEFESFIDKMNVFACYKLLESFQISDEVFKAAIQTFSKPHHRLQKVATLSGVEFINDSKATNIDAVIQALRSIEKPVILLAGGIDKGHPYSEWIPYLNNVKKIVCFGSAKQVIFSQLSSNISCTMCQSLSEAVHAAYLDAASGDVILLSPGCSSFDEFKDYQDRGEKFCQNVHNLQPKESFL